MGIFRAASCFALTVAVPATAQQPPADPAELPLVPGDYAPARTEWGDPDFRAIYTLDNINLARIAFQRPDEFGDRFWLTDEEFAAKLESARASDARFNPENTQGSSGLEQWMLSEPFARRSSMLVSPASGKLPPLTPEAQALYSGGRSSWVPNQAYDWLDDFDIWDRCVTRGFPASMLPFRYNNGLRVFQAPGFVAIHLEMLGDRIIPIGRNGHRPAAVRSWMGDSRGHWEGDTLVIETTNIVPGDNASHDVARRAASPLNMATQGVPPYNSIPTSAQARAVERLTMTGPDTVVYELTYSDSEVFTGPWTARISWTRSDTYQMFEYACHEGNVSIRNNINATRAQRREEAAAAAGVSGLSTEE